MTKRCLGVKKVLIWRPGAGTAEPFPTREIKECLAAVYADEDAGWTLLDGLRVTDAGQASVLALRTDSDAFVALSADTAVLENVLRNLRGAGVMAARVDPGKLESEREAAEISDVMSGEEAQAFQGRRI